jgi:hypothetical protein
LLVEFRIDHQVRAVDQQRVAVGRGLRRASGADIAASASEILDVELRLHLLRELLRQEAGENVSRTARREWHDHAHRPRRIIERGGGVRQRAEEATNRRG